MRGTVVRILVTRGPCNTDELKRQTGILKRDLYKALEVLEKESMVAEDNGVYRIKD
jgi:predicted transcriptional regulator